MPRPSARDLGHTLALATVLVVTGADTAPAVEVCTAAQVSAIDPGCPSGTGLCSVTTSLEVGEDCMLDFGVRPLRVASGGELVGIRGNVDIKAGSLSIESGGSIDASGRPPNEVGGAVRITTSGDVLVLGPTGVIDVSGRNGGGVIRIEADGMVRIGGKLLAPGRLGFGSGGDIVIRTGGDFETIGDAEVSVQGARDGIGGVVDVFARGRIVLRTLIEVSGGEGGLIDLFSAGAIELAAVRGRGTGEAGSGGCMTAVAGTTLTARDLIDFNGTGGSFGGGCGGFICLEAVFGDINVLDDIRAEGAAPDGGGGSVAFIATGSLLLPVDHVVSVSGNGTQGCGGEICIDVGGQATARGLLDASGGSAGGDVDITARRNIVVSGGLTVSGRAADSFAGTTFIEAGFDATGDLLVTSPIDLTAAMIGGIAGGLAQLTGCNVDLPITGSIAGQAPEGAIIAFTAREQLTVRGTVDARSSGGPTPTDGQIRIEHPSRKPPMIMTLIQPPPQLLARDTCTTQPVNCLDPCPACGNGVVEYPEDCDDGPGMPASCDGCSLVCRTEDCDDGLICTVDHCEPQLGCGHTPRDPPPTRCFEPAQFSRTPTPTVTPTPSQTPTITLTPLFTFTPTPTFTQPTATPTESATPAPSPTATAPACVGDCDGLGSVSVNELVLGVNIAIAGAAVDDCLNLDRDRNGQVTIDELVAAVGNALNGCL